MKLFLRYVLSVVVAFFAIAYTGIVGFFVYNESAIVFPGADLGEQWLYLPPASVAMPWDSVRVQAEDGVPVFLLESRLEGIDGAPWIIYFHGNGQLVGDQSGIARYRLLREVGFNVLAVEYRGYGMSRSSGAPSEEGVYLDAKAGWTYLTNVVGVEPDRIVLYGMSLGSGLATHLASQVSSAGLITEGAFTSLPARGQEIYPWMPVTLLMRNRFDNLTRAESLLLPWLLLHGRDDQIVPFSHAEKLASTAANAYVVELGGGHVVSVVDERDVLMPALQQFVAGLFGTAQDWPANKDK